MTEITLDKGIPEFNPRRPLEDDCPEGYMESDQDFVLNNIEICITFLELIEKGVIKLRKE